MTSENAPIRIDTSAPPVAEKRSPIFYIGDTEYTAPDTISAGDAITALRIAAEDGMAAAAWHCLVSAIGQQAIDDLVACPQLSYPDAQKILTAISDRFFGQAMGIAGK